MELWSYPLTKGLKEKKTLFVNLLRFKLRNHFLLSIFHFLKTVNTTEPQCTLYSWTAMCFIKRIIPCPVAQTETAMTENDLYVVCRMVKELKSCGQKTIAASASNLCIQFVHPGLQHKSPNLGLQDKRCILWLVFLPTYYKDILGSLYAYLTVIRDSSDD